MFFSKFSQNFTYYYSIKKFHENTTNQKHQGKNPTQKVQKNPKNPPVKQHFQKILANFNFLKMRIFWVIFREIFAGYLYVRRFSRKYESESFVSILHDFPVKDVNLICFSSSVEGNEFPASNRKDFPFLPSPSIPLPL